MNYTDRIFPTNKGLTTYLDELLSKNYQIPTFQREVVWEKENVKKLWDSIYKFYPLGSILIWKTDLKLQNHRQVGGHQIADPNFNRIKPNSIARPNIEGTSAKIRSAAVWCSFPILE